MFISHRVNFLNSEIANKVFSESDGIEFDIRDVGGMIVVTHDPYAFLQSAQPFETFLAFCPADKFYIVNVKCEGVAERAIHLLEARGIRQFFILDCGIPELVKLAVRGGERRFAVRFSEYESLASVEALAPYVDWVWVDCFTRLPLTYDTYWALRWMNLRLCLVSPDLQGRAEDIPAHIRQLKDGVMPMDAVCAKHSTRGVWRSASVLSPCPSSPVRVPRHLTEGSGFPV